jgi:hypothetical protein
MDYLFQKRCVFLKDTRFNKQMPHLNEIGSVRNLSIHKAYPFIISKDIQVMVSSEKFTYFSKNVVLSAFKN